MAAAGGTPFEQWDNIGRSPSSPRRRSSSAPSACSSPTATVGRRQPGGLLISSQVHYTKGGKPGYYPPIKGRVGGQIQFNLYDPFNWFPEQGAEQPAASSPRSQRPRGDDRHDSFSSRRVTHYPFSRAGLCRSSTASRGSRLRRVTPRRFRTNGREWTGLGMLGMATRLHARAEWTVKTCWDGYDKTQLSASCRTTAVPA